MVTLTATVNAGATPVNPGQVKFCDAAAAYGTDIHLLATAQLTGAGTATFRFVPGIGNHSYKAIFVGTTANAASASATASLAVSPSGAGSSLPTATIASSGAPPAAKHAEPATVTGTGLVSPTGNVTFIDTDNLNYPFGTVSLGTGAAGLSFAKSSPSPVATSPAIGCILPTSMATVSPTWLWPRSGSRPR